MKDEDGHVAEGLIMICGGVCSVKTRRHGGDRIYLLVK